MNIVGEICDFLLLAKIEFSLVYTVFDNIVSELGTCKMMKNKSLFACIDYFSVEKFLKFFRKFSFFCKLFEYCENIVINCLCSIIVSKACCHGNAVILYSLRAVFAAHCFFNAYFLFSFKFLERFECIKVFPISHH